MDENFLLDCPSPRHVRACVPIANSQSRIAAVAHLKEGRGVASSSLCVAPRFVTETQCADSFITPFWASSSVSSKCFDTGSDGAYLTDSGMHPERHHLGKRGRTDVGAKTERSRRNGCPEKFASERKTYGLSHRHFYTQSPFYSREAAHPATLCLH